MNRMLCYFIKPQIKLSNHWLFFSLLVPFAFDSPLLTGCELCLSLPPSFLAKTPGDHGRWIWRKAIKIHSTNPWPCHPIIADIYPLHLFRCLQWTSATASRVMAASFWHVWTSPSYHIAAQPGLSKLDSPAKVVTSPISQNIAHCI